MVRPDESTPLVSKGFGAPRFLENSQDKFLANEDENAYVQLEVFGDPPPTVTWMKGNVDLATLDRFQSWTCGKKGFVFLGVECAQKDDEGIYKCVIVNRFGRREHKFKLFIARSWQSRPAPPKKEVPIYWSEIPRSKFIKEGHKETVFFTAKLTVANKTGVWSFNGQECKNGDKYEISSGGGNFTICIKNPLHADTGCYRCSLVGADLSCETYLDVQLPDPEYSFLRPLDGRYHGFTGRPLRLTCLASPDAKIAWFKDLKQVKSDNNIKITSDQGEHMLAIESLSLPHAGYYECRITRFGKEGADFCATDVDVEEFPHKFSRKLGSNMEIVERNDLVLQVCTEEKDAEVKWFKDNKQIQLERKRHQRLHMIHNEFTHQLKIERACVNDTGVYKAATNVDSTEINVVVEEYPFMLSEKLASQVSVMEGGRLTLEVKVVDEEAEVEWCLNGIKLETSRSRSSRLQTTSYGHTRTLQIKRAEASDSGILSARTNKDVSQTKLQVKCHNSFLERLPDIIEVPHNSKVEFKVKVRDVFAPVYFSIDRLPIELEDGSIEQEDDGLGNHKLIIYKVQTTDAGLLCCKTPSNRGEEMLQSKCIMNVTQGESPPVLGPADPVSCVAILHSFSERMNSYIHKEQCRLVIPYKIEGTRMSTLDILVEKDGEPVEVGNEIQLRVQTDKIIIDVINPQRIYSGLYKVTMSNEQGSGSIEIPVSIMDIPSPPKAAWVDEVFKESVTVYWKEPKDDGGCEIKHYVVECLDVTMGNLWVSLAMTDSGEPRSIQARNLIEGHRYMFRVAAANKVGQSEPCEVRGVTLVRDPWDCPGECGRCTVIDWMPTFADLTWTQPFSDGGAPIISYIIQLKEKSMREWIDSIEIPVEELEIDGNVIKGRCENLVEEYEYMFRVLAVNKGGRGHPGPPSQSVIAMYKNIPPSIKEGNIRDLKIKEGRSIRFDVWIAGEPAPTIEWLRNDEKIVPDEKTSINVYSKNASVYTLKNVVLSIPKALEEDHSGVYKLRLKNESGVFESMADINIEPPPGKQKKSKPKEEKKKEKEEEDEEKDQQQVQPEILRKLSTEGKEEDKDSGLKIGEESLPDSEESVWTEYTESSEEQELDLTGTAVTTPVANDSLTDEQKENAYNSKHHSNSTLKSKSDKEIIAEVSDDEGVQGVEQSDDHSSDGEFVMDTNIIETNNQEVQSSYKTQQNTNDSQSYNEHFDINNDVSNNTDHEEYKICNNIVSNKNMDDHENSFNNDNTQNTEGEENTDYYENNDLSNNATFNYNSFNNCESYQSNDFPENESNDNDYSSNIYNSYNNALHNNESSEIDNIESKASTDHENKKMNDCNGDYRSNGISNQSSYSDNNSDNYEENSDYITARNNSNENSNVDNNNYCYYNNELDDSNQDNTDTEIFNGTSNGFSTSYTNGSCYGGSYMESNTEVDSKEPEQSEEEKKVIMDRQKREEKRKLEEKAKEDRRLAKEKQRQEELDRLEALVREEERLKREVALERERKRQEELAEQARIKEEKEKEEKRKKEEKIKNEAELKLQQENLNKRLEHLGFIKSSKAAVFDYTNGDGVLISLLDQMNRDDQNFKVWDREDYSFLRWYMTRQMEAYIMKEKELPFVNLIEGDKLEYIERITEDYVHLDEIFLNAAASVFNKDIIIIPSDEKEEVRVLYGGAGTTKGKGSPLYLGCVGPIGETIPVQYYSIMQDQNSKVKFVYSDSTIDRRISVIANGELIPSSPKIKLKDDRKRSWKRMDSYTGGNSKDLDNMINSIMLEENMDELFDRLDSCEDDLEEDENADSINSKKDDDCSDIDKSLYAICDNVSEVENNKSEWHESAPYATHVVENNEEEQNTLEEENTIQECLTTSESYSPFENSCENNNTEIVNNEEWSCESDSSSSIHDENIKVQEDEEVPAHQNQWQNYYGNYYYNQPNTEEDTETLETESVNDTETTEVMDATHESASQVSNDDSGWYSNAADYQYNSYGWYNNEQIDENVKDDAQEEGNTNTEDSREATPVNEIDYSNESNNDEKWNSDEVNENLNDADSESCDYNDRNVINHDSEMYYTDTQNRLTPSIEITSEYIGNSDESTPEPSEVANDSSEEVLPAELSNDIKTPTLTEDTSKFEKENSFLSTDFVNKQNEPSNIPTSLSALDNLDFSSPFGSTNQDEAPQPGVKLRQRRYSRRKSTTSFRWSGSEFEMDNPDSANQDADSTSNSNDQSKICNSTDQLKANFTENIAKFGLKETVPEPSKCKDTCLVSLMSQMMLAGEDFKVWDKDDHSFLSWYIVKQMDAQISTGKAATFLNLEKKHSEDIESAFRSGSPTKSQYFIRAFARVFNRDVIVVDSNGTVDYLHGGVNSKHGKGQPLIIGMIKDISNGSEDVVYSSLEPNFDAERYSIVETLSHQCKA